MSDPRPSRPTESFTKAAVRAKLFTHRAPPKIGRFAILDQLGAGGMGQVYRAYDPQLRREVAVKVLSGSADTGEDSQGRQRLLREARAMAQISHPNVLPVFEAGEHETQVFVAMELVTGGTLREWVGAEPRPWREIVSAYVQAGRGLVEAHAQGLIHRDFKPDNVLVDRDDGDGPVRVRVMDFGLARPRHLPDPPRSATGSHSPQTLGLTVTGAVLGTPAYMAPEQFRGDATDERSDQFSFCVALWEALYGQRPFAGRSPLELGANVGSGAIVAPPAGRDVPATLRRLLERGMQPDPGARHETLAGRVAELQRLAAPPKRRLAAAVLVLFGLLCGAAIAAVASAPTSTEPSCLSSAQQLAGVWDEPTRQQLQARFTHGVLPSFVAPSWRRLRDRNDAWVQEWTAQYETTCAADPGHDPAAQIVHARRAACLQSALAGLQAQVDDLRSEAVERMAALEPHVRLPSLDVCADDAASARLSPLPDDAALRTRVTQLRTELARVRRHQVSGSPRRALSRLDALQSEAERVGYRPLIAEVGAARALALSMAGDPGAVAAIRRAIRTADEAGHERVVFDLLLELHAHLSNLGGFVDIPSPTDPDLERERRALVDRLEILASREGTTALMRHAVQRAKGATATAMGDHDAAQRILESIVAERHEGDDALGEAEALGWLARAQYGASRNEHARQSLRTALALYGRVVGPGHPAAGGLEAQLANVQMRMGELEASAAGFERAIEAQRSLDPDGERMLGWLEGRLGTARIYLGQPEAGLAALERSEQLLIAATGADASETLRGPTLDLARQYLTRGDLDRARPRIARLIAPTVTPETRMFGDGLAAELAARDGDAERSQQFLARLDAAAASVGTPPVMIVGIELERSACAAILGDVEAAIAAARRSVDAADEAPPFDAVYPFDVQARVQLGVLLVDTGHYAEAIPHLRDGIARTRGPAVASVLPHGPRVHFALARALWETGGDRAQARRLATSAMEGYAELGGPALLDELAHVEAWLRGHPAPSETTVTPAGSRPRRGAVRV